MRLRSSICASFHLLEGRAGGHLGKSDRCDVWRVDSRLVGAAAHQLLPDSDGNPTRGARPFEAKGSVGDACFFGLNSEGFLPRR